MSLKLDEADLLIIALLRDEARLSLRDLGARVNLSAPAVAARLKRLEDAKIIEGYRAVISADKFALAFEALIFVKVIPADSERFIDEMKALPAVSSCLKITGDYSYMLTVSFPKIDALNHFVDKLNMMYGMTKTSIILNKEISLRSPFTLYTLRFKN